MSLVAWSQRFDSTWLADEDACGEVDEHIETFLARHHEQRPVAFLRNRTTAAVLRDAGRQPDRSIHCTILLSLLGELLLTAERGGIFSEADDGCLLQGPANNDEEGRESTVKALRLMRNTVCHPGSFLPQGDRGIAVESLLDHLGGAGTSVFRGETWTGAVRASPAQLNSREVAAFTLRLVDNVGSWQSERWRLRWVRRAQRRHSR